MKNYVTHIYPCLLFNTDTDPVGKFLTQPKYRVIIEDFFERNSFDDTICFTFFLSTDRHSNP